ncbi:MAG: hypothetical protein HY318_04510 [Armatimonadetes bacterium]|nr:hypothetical protein [Armatimonadota bacterium]
MARSAPRQQLRAIGAASAPVIDGTFEDPCWKEGEWKSGFLLNDESGRKAEAQTLFKVAFDSAHVYIAAKCLEPKMSQLKSFWGPRHDEGIFNDDCIELWFDVNNLHQRSYHIILSNAGGVYDAVDTQSVVDDPKAANVGVKTLVTDTDLSWDTKTVAACRKDADTWILEARVPVADLGVEEVLPGSVWGFNIGRERWADGPEFSSLTGIFQFPLERYAEVHFGEPRVVASLEGAEDIGFGDNRIVLHLKNPTQQQQEYRVAVQATSGQTQVLTRRVRLQPGMTKDEQFVCRFEGTGVYRLLTTISSLRGEKDFRQERVTPYARTVDLSLRSRNYYCGETAMVNVALHTGNATREQSRLRVALIDETGREVASDEVREVRAPSLRLRLNLSMLRKPGFYALRLVLMDGTGEELVKEEQMIRVVEAPHFKEDRR